MRNDNRVDSLEKLLVKRPELERVVHDPNEMKDVYRYTFGYAKTKDQKCMDVDVSERLVRPKEKAPMLTNAG